MCWSYLQEFYLHSPAFLLKATRGSIQISFNTHTVHFRMGLLKYCKRWEKSDGSLHMYTVSKGWQSTELVKSLTCLLALEQLTRTQTFHFCQASSQYWEEATCLGCIYPPVCVPAYGHGGSAVFKIIYLQNRVGAAVLFPASLAGIWNGSPMPAWAAPSCTTRKDRRSWSSLFLSALPSQKPGLSVC